MRSRYSAFALGDVPYLRRTWHRSTRPRRLELDPGVRWTGLEILASTESTVEFRATSTAGVLHERSRFVQEDGRWYYVDGELSP
jgi:SEC-C motif-containing protein